MAAPTLIGANLTGNISNSVQVAEVSPAFTVETGSTAGVVVPFIANMYVDASGTVGTLQQVTVSMSGIDEVFNVTVSNANAVKILNAFAVTDISAGYAQDPRAQVKVDMKGEGDFIDGLAAAISGTTLATSASYAAESLYAWLKRETRKDTVDLLSYDSLSNLLEASDLLTYDIALDASGASSNMYDAMNAGSAQYRKAIFAQISKANIDLYAAPSDGSVTNSEAASGLGFLPLLKGDKLTFVFDVTVGEYTMGSDVAPTSGAQINSVANDMSTAAPSGAHSSNSQQSGAISSGLAATATDYNANNAQLLFTTPSKRRVAIVVQMATGGGAFTKSAAGVPTVDTTLTA